MSTIKRYSGWFVKMATKGAAMLMLFILFVLCGNVQGQESDTVVYDDNFVIASLVVADPGDILYSRVGHLGIHMECPDHNLDYVFSYESEDVRHKVPAFLAGKLRMGMFAIPTKEYLDQYRSEGRGVRQYTLNLPIEVKRELWRVLDNHMLEGANLPYDYITYGCAHSALMMLKEALDTIPIEYGPWPERFLTETRRELTAHYMAKSSPWSWCFLYLISGGSIDYECPVEDKLIMPVDLVEVLQKARVQGCTMLESEAHLLLDGKPMPVRPFVTPLMVSLLLLLLTALCVVMKKSWMDYVLLALQTLLGIITVYLVCFSKLCCTEWSWLIIPFNPLPLIVWKWRRHWVLPYAVILVLWIVFILLWPHRLTDWPYVILTASLMLSYVGIFVNEKNRVKK